MSNEHTPPPEPHRPRVYEIRLGGHLDRSWAAWFEGLSLTLEGGDTLLTGPVLDQAALHGLLKRVRDLGMPLISVSPVDAGRLDASDA
jgi:hypothetical protein